MGDFFGHKSNITFITIITIIKFIILCYNITMANQKVNPNFATDVVNELKKVSWPSRTETIRLTTIVIIVSLIIGLYV
ncbi:MAG: preprotein translocase subunit SecE, partial [Patescibacteria group bacterium]